MSVVSMDDILANISIEFRQLHTRGNIRYCIKPKTYLSCCRKYSYLYSDKTTKQHFKNPFVFPKQYIYK